MLDSQRAVSVIFTISTLNFNRLDTNLPPSANLFVTYRITGTFTYIKARTVKGQEYPGQPLSELGDSQFVSTYDNISGTVIGFRSPKAFQGLAVAGEHLHFISEDRKMGGHVLEISGDNLKMGMARVKDVHIELPTGKDFNEATLVSDDAGIKKVEG
jgi:alpha-acetolactate decarboxylase